MWKRGKSCFSNRATRRPDLATWVLKAAPDGPPPITTTSYDSEFEFTEGGTFARRLVLEQADLREEDPRDGAVTIRSDTPSRESLSAPGPDFVWSEGAVAMIGLDLGLAECGNAPYSLLYVSGWMTP